MLGYTQDRQNRAWRQYLAADPRSEKGRDQDRAELGR